MFIKLEILSRLVAVKILKKEFANNKDISDKFKKEATAVANFSDANIVNVLDVGHEEEEDIDYFVMEYVNGKTLKDLIISSGKLNYTTAISIAIQIAKALERPRLPDCIRRGTVVVCYSGQTFVVAKVYPPRCPLAVLCDVHDPHPVG